MKIYFIVLIMVLLSCYQNKITKNVNNSSVKFIWKMDSCPFENKYDFTMYFFLNNDTVIVISNYTMLKFNYLEKNDSIIIGNKRFLTKKLANDEIQLFENEKLHSTVKVKSMDSLFWDSYNLNFNIYCNKVEPLILEDEILMDSK